LIELCVIHDRRRRHKVENGRANGFPFNQSPPYLSGYHKSRGNGATEKKGAQICTCNLYNIVNLDDVVVFDVFFHSAWQLSKFCFTIVRSGIRLTMTRMLEVDGVLIVGGDHNKEMNPATAAAITEALVWS
jgi:hypothetical protein